MRSNSNPLIEDTSRLYDPDAIDKGIRDARRLRAEAMFKALNRVRNAFGGQK